jgi:Major Facilitator Superfamily
VLVSPARARRPLPRQVRLLALARAVNQLGAFSLAFLTVLLCRVLGASLAEAGLVSAVFGLATIPSRLIGGRLSSRLGARRTILTGLIGCAVAQLGIAVAPDLAVAACCALLLGFTFELYEPPSQAMIADATTPGERAPAYALLTTALAVGNMGAGLVADAVGRSGLRWLFVVDAATCLVCALIVYRALPADRVIARTLSRRPRRAACGSSPWRDRALLAMTAAGAAFALVYMLMLVALPLSLTAYGINPASAGLVMAVATLTLVLARPLLRTAPLAGLSGATASGIGFCLMAAGMAGYAMAHTLAGLMVPTVSWSIGNLLLTGRAFAVVTGLAPAGATAHYLAVYGLSWGIATVAAPVLATQLISTLGPASLWLASGALCTLMAAVQPWLLRRLASHQRQAMLAPSPRQLALAQAATASD